MSRTSQVDFATTRAEDQDLIGSQRDYPRQRQPSRGPGWFGLTIAERFAPVMAGIFCGECAHVRSLTGGTGRHVR